MAGPRLEGVLELRDRLTGRLAQASRSVRSFGGETSAVGRVVGDFSGRVERASGSVNRLSTVSGVAGRAVRGLGGILGGVERRFYGLVSSVGGFVKQTLGFAAIMGSVSAMLAPAVLFKGVVQAAGDFEQAMAYVNTIAKASGDELARMRQRVLDLSKVYPQSPEVLARGLYDILSAAFEGEEGLQILEVSARAATAGLTDVATASRPISAILKAYAMDASKAAYVSDVMFRTVERGIVTFPELAQNIGDVIGIASQARVPLEEVGAAVALMTQGGVVAAEAFTSLNQLLLSFVDMTPQSRAAFEELGLNIDASTLAAEGLGGVMSRIVKALGLSQAEVNALTDSTVSDARAQEILAQKTGDTIEALSRFFPNVRALRGALQLVRNGGADFRAELELMKQATGATGRAFEEVAGTFITRWTLFTNALTRLKIAVGTELLPSLSAGVIGLTGFINRITETPEFERAGFVEKVRLLAEGATRELAAWLEGGGREQVIAAGESVGRGLATAVMAAFGMEVKGADKSPWVEVGREFGKAFGQGFRETFQLGRPSPGGQAAMMIGGAAAGYAAGSVLGLGPWGGAAGLLAGSAMAARATPGVGWPEVGVLASLALLYNRVRKALGGAGARAVPAAKGLGQTAAEVAATVEKAAPELRTIYGPRGEILSQVAAEAPGAAAQMVRGTAGAARLAGPLAWMLEKGGGAAGKLAGTLGKAALPLALITSGVDIIKSQDKAKAVGRQVGGWAGFLGGMKLGALGGGALGSVVPGLGTGIGAVIGGLLGGVAGSLGGQSLGEKVVGWFRRPAQEAVNTQDKLTNASDQAAASLERLAGAADAAAGVPGHAEGGIVRGAQVALVGEAGAEAIIPLEQNRARALALWQEAGRRLGVPGLAEGGIVEASRGASWRVEVSGDRARWRRLGGLPGLPPVEMLQEVEKAATAMGVPPALLAGLIQAESAWRPGAVSPVGAIGLTQVMPGTARGMGYDPAALARDWQLQIWAGARYLGEMLRQFGDVDLALAAYNAGPGAVRRWGGVPPYEETQAYVPRVRRYAEEFAPVFGPSVTNVNVTVQKLADTVVVRDEADVEALAGQFANVIKRALGNLGEVRAAEAVR